ATTVGYGLAANLPELFAAAILLLTPLAFLLSTARNCRQLADILALVLGLAGACAGAGLGPGLGPRLAAGWGLAGCLECALCRENRPEKDEIPCRPRSRRANLAGRAGQQPTGLSTTLPPAPGAP
ncbi:MAG: hypothetical protein ABJD68_16325, partial [Nakamurella sp.]